MILDKLMAWVEDGDLTSHALSAVLDLSSPNAGAGEPIPISVSAPLVAGTGPLVLTVTQCATVGGTYLVHSTITLTTAQLAAGMAKFFISHPSLQFLKVLPSGTFSAGTLDIYAPLDVQTNS